MLDTEKIKEAESNMRKYLEDKLIFKEIVEQEVFQTYVKNSGESLEVAELILENRKSHLWIIVTSYYAMYYLANAVLCKLGYKVGDKISHKVTSDALIVFVRNKLAKSLLENYENAKEEAMEIVRNKADSIIINYDYERDKRGRLQYNMKEEVKEGKAITSLTRAKEFINEMKNLIY